MLTIDMHVHSTYSDGTATVEEIAYAAKKRGLALISLTDHDTTAGVAPFMKVCKHYEVNGLSGIELSAEADFILHILGYRIDSNTTELELALDKIRLHRDERNVQICDKLQKLGMDIQIEEVRALSKGQVVARPHIATLMLSRGYAANRAQAFAKYLGRGGLAYVARQRFSAEKCIELIKNAGGLAVIAHPLQAGLDDENLRKLISRLKDAGLWGIESIYSGNEPAETYKCLSLAKEFELYSTAGSDFHGSVRPTVTIGKVVTEDFLPWARLGISI